MKSRNWRAFVASAVLAVMIGFAGQRIPAECAVEAAAERIAGFHPARSVAVEQAVELIRHREYSLALLRLTAEKNDTSMPAQARVFSAYVFLMAGNSFGAFPERG